MYLKFHDDYVDRIVAEEKRNLLSTQVEGDSDAS